MRRGIVADLVQRLAHDPGEIRLLGDGKQTRSYLHVKDCVAALRAAATVVEADEAAFSAFHVCNQDAISARRVAEIVAEEFPNGTPEIGCEGGRQGWRGDVPSLLIRPEALEERGWQPRLTSEEAVRDTARTLLADQRSTTRAQ